MTSDADRVDLELTGSAIQKASASVLAMVFGQAIVAVIAWLYVSQGIALLILTTAMLVGGWRRALHHRWPLMSSTATGFRRARLSFLGMVGVLATTRVRSIATVYPQYPRKRRRCARPGRGGHCRDAVTGRSRSCCGGAGACQKSVADDSVHRPRYRSRD